MTNLTNLARGLIAEQLRTMANHLSGQLPPGGTEAAILHIIANDIDGAMRELLNGAVVLRLPTKKPVLILPIEKREHRRDKR